MPVKQFDAPNNKKRGDEDVDDDDDKDAADLCLAVDKLEGDLEDDGSDEDGNDWEFDMRIELNEEEIKELEETVKPVRRVLTKVILLYNICLPNTYH